MGKRIVVVGSNFAGLTAALELRKQLPPEHEVIVLSKSGEFVFMPSLIWLPFGLRKREDITFPLKPVYEKKGVPFKQVEVTEILPAQGKVKHSEGEERFDYLVIATGPVNHWAAVPGLGPDGHAQSIFGISDAERAGAAFEAFLRKPGPVVIGAAPGTGCFGAAYEFLFNFAHQIKRRGLVEQVPITYVTAEPFLAHFGIGGFGSGTKMTEMFFKMSGITGITNAAITKVDPGEVVLSDGRRLPFAYSMIAPAFQGVPAVRALKEITNAAGMVEVNGQYQTAVYPNVYAAGVAIALAPPAATPVPCGVPKTGYMSEEMAKVVVHNIVADIHGLPKLSLAPGAIDAKCVLDAGNNGIIMSGDHLLEPREHSWLIPGPEAHWAKLAFEKYFLFTRRHGWV